MCTAVIFVLLLRRHHSLHLSRGKEENIKDTRVVLLELCLVHNEQKMLLTTDDYERGMFEWRDGKLLTLHLCCSGYLSIVRGRPISMQARSRVVYPLFSMV